MQRTEQHDVQLGVHELWGVIRPALHRILATTIFCGLLGYAVTLLLPNRYTAEAVVMPAVMSRASGSTLSLLGQLLGDSPIQQTRSGQMLAILNSRTLAEWVVEQGGLRKPLEQWLKRPLTKEQAAQALLRFVVSKEDKRFSTISVKITLPDPGLAQHAVTTYLSELERFIAKNSFTQAKRNRLFVEQQVQLNKRELLEAGKELNSFYKGGHISNVESMIDVPLNGHDFLRDAPLGHLEHALPQSDMTVHDVPQQVFLQYLSLRRELLGKIATVLTQQHEGAKMEEVREELSFQVIDPPLLPQGPSSPRRLLIGIFVGFIAGISYLGLLLMRTTRHS